MRCHVHAREALIDELRRQLVLKRLKENSQPRQMGPRSINNEEIAAMLNTTTMRVKQCLGTPCKLVDKVHEKLRPNPRQIVCSTFRRNTTVLESTCDVDWDRQYRNARLQCQEMLREFGREQRQPLSIEISNVPMPPVSRQEIENRCNNEEPGSFIDRDALIARLKR